MSAYNELSDSRNADISTFVGVIGGIIFGIACWRYLSRVLHREELIIDEDSITIISSEGKSKTINSYLVDNIQDLRYIGFEKPVDHPLKNASFDYLGFQTQLEVVNSVMAEGNIAFNYKGKAVRFFIGVPSWDASELNTQLVSKTNGRLSIAELPEELSESEWM